MSKKNNNGHKSECFSGDGTMGICTCGFSYEQEKQLVKPTSTPYVVREGEGVFHIVRPWNENTRADREPTFGSGLGAHIADLQFHVGDGVATKEKAKANADFLTLAANSFETLVRGLEMAIGCFGEDPKWWKEHSEYCIRREMTPDGMRAELLFGLRVTLEKIKEEAVHG